MKIDQANQESQYTASLTLKIDTLFQSHYVWNDYFKLSVLIWDYQLFFSSEDGKRQPYWSKICDSWLCWRYSSNDYSFNRWLLSITSSKAKEDAENSYALQRSLCFRDSCKTFWISYQRKAQYIYYIYHNLPLTSNFLVSCLNTIAKVPETYSVRVCLFRSVYFRFLQVVFVFMKCLPWLRLWISWEDIIYAYYDRVSVSVNPSDAFALSGQRV